MVTAGTATTADVLKGDGTFAGGAILPGLDLMKRSLAHHTAGLPLTRGRFSIQPRNTADAIETGCLLAQAGAIERMFAAMEPGAACLLAGGAAGRIARHLSIPAQLVDNLVLEGLVRIAEEVENLSALDRPVAWTQHVTLGDPFIEPGATQFQASATKSKVIEYDFTGGVDPPRRS